MKRNQIIFKRCVGRTDKHGQIYTAIDSNKEMLPILYTFQ